MQRQADTHERADPTARVVLITGAASGIGLAAARRLARNGLTVYGGFRPGGRSAPPQESSPHDGIRWLPLDVTAADSRAEALQAIGRAHGRLDVLVNNAGIHAAGPLEEIPERALREVMEVNFFGAIACTRSFLPLLRRGSRGVILMVSSLSALIGLPFDGAYAASKFALEGASESLRYELEPLGIRVVLLQPGAYATALAARVYPELPSSYPAYEAIRRQRVASRAGGAQPEEAAAVIEAVLKDSAAPLRVPCGAQAVSVVERLSALNERQRRDFAFEVSGLGPAV